MIFSRIFDTILSTIYNLFCKLTLTGLIISIGIVSVDRTTGVKTFALVGIIFVGSSIEIR
jgi:hypothetical protein